MDGMCGLLRHAEGIADLSPTALRAEPLRRASSTGSSAEADAPPAGEGRRGVRAWNRPSAPRSPVGVDGTGVRSNARQATAARGERWRERAGRTAEGAAGVGSGVGAGAGAGIGCPDEVRPAMTCRTALTLFSLRTLPPGWVWKL